MEFSDTSLFSYKIFSMQNSFPDITVSHHHNISLVKLSFQPSVGLEEVEGLCSTVIERAEIHPLPHAALSSANDSHHSGTSAQSLKASVLPVR